MNEIKKGDIVFFKHRNRPVEILSNLIDGEYYEGYIINTKNKTIIKTNKLMKLPTKEIIIYVNKLNDEQYNKIKLISERCSFIKLMK